MQLPAPLSRISPIAAALIAFGILVAAYIGYDEFAEPAPVVAAPEATEPAEPPPIARSPLQRLKDSADAGNVKDQMLLAVNYSTGQGYQGSGGGFSLVT